VQVLHRAISCDTEKKRLITLPEAYSTMMPRLTLTVLADNTTLTDHDFTGEPGLSFLIGTAGKKILFDTGLSGLFIANAEKMGISLSNLDLLILSHGHIDHTGGLLPLIRHLDDATSEGGPARVPELVAHPRCFWPKIKEEKRNGSEVSEEEARVNFTLRLSAEPVWLTDDLVFLGEIPWKFAFEQTDPGARKICLPDGSTEPDELLDDSALAFRSDKGLVIITGCSHAGICNITEYARDVCAENRVAAIIGGLHLISPPPRRLKMTGEYLRKLQPGTLFACHCTSLPAKIALAAYCPVQETGVGMKLAW
jgi:7,8-dihydropterin-6-yl-methyl-4-(beta-D-ribofuranosyl)aminobenzene 5'-phosphate synthase